MSDSTKLTRRRATLNTTTGLALAARWRDSGMSLAAFGRQERISADVVKYWANKARTASTVQEQSGFYVLQPEQPERLAYDVTEANQGRVVVLVVPATGPALQSTLEAVGIGAKR